MVKNGGGMMNKQLAVGNKLSIFGVIFCLNLLFGTSAKCDWVQAGGILNMNINENGTTPSMAMFNGTPYVAWREPSVVQYQIFVKHYDGSSWIQDGASLNVNPSMGAADPHMAMYNGTPYVTFWEVNIAAGGNQVYVKHYNGVSWVWDGGSLNVDPGQNAYQPFIAFSNSTPYVTWEERNGAPTPKSQIYVRHYNGSSWLQDGGSLNVNTNQDGFWPSMAVANTTPYVTWYESDGTHYQIYVKHYDGSSWIQDGGSLNINTSQHAYCPVMVMSNNTPYVIWREYFSPGTHIFVKHWNGSDWDQVGAGSLNVNANQGTKAPDLAVYNGTLYASWMEWNGTTEQIYVKHYNGSTWIQDNGSLNVNMDQDAYSPSIANSNGIPYVSWQEGNGLQDKIYVKHFDIAFTPVPTATPYGTPTKAADENSGGVKAYPMPAQGKDVWFSYPVAGPSQVIIEIRNVSGKKCAEIKDTVDAVGYHQTHWDIQNIGSGVYLYRIQVENAQGKRNFGWQKLAISK